MLKILRKKGVAKKVIWFIAIIIIISFGFFGTASLLSDQNNASYAGKVFGKKISFDKFEKIYSHVVIQAIIRYGENFNKIREHLDLESQTWDRLILIHEAKKRKIKISDEEVIAEIEEYPFFQNNGQFDSTMYANILSYVLRIQAREFEESVRDSLKFKKIFQSETSNLYPSEETIFQAYKKRNEKIQISYVMVNSKDFKNQLSIDKETALDFYEKNKSSFQVPPSINVEFVALPLEEIEPINDEALTPEENIQKDATLKKNSEIEEMNSKMREIANQIYFDSLDNPSNFSKIAKDSKYDTQTSGFFSAEKPNLNLGWPYELLNVVFNYEQGAINEPFETTSAIYLTKVIEKRESFIPEFEEARESVAQNLVDIKSKEIAKEKANEHLIAIKTELSKTKLKDFPKAAKNLGLEIKQTPSFTRGQYLPNIGISMNFQETAFQLNDAKNISEVVEIENGYCILHLDNYIPVDQKKFNSEKDNFAETLIDSIRNEAFNDFMVRLRLAARIEDNLKKLRESSATQQ